MELSWAMNTMPSVSAPEKRFTTQLVWASARLEVGMKFYSAFLIGYKSFLTNLDLRVICNLSQLYIRGVFSFLFRRSGSGRLLKVGRTYLVVRKLL